MRSPLLHVAHVAHVAHAALLAVALGACSASPGRPPVDVPTPERVDLPALEARLETANGQRGILLHFWASW